MLLGYTRSLEASGKASEGNHRLYENSKNTTFEHAFSQFVLSLAFVF